MSGIKPNLQGAFSGPPLESTSGIGELTLSGFLSEVTQKFSNREAIVFDDPLRNGETVRWSYSDLAGHSRQIARALLVHGAKRGDAVAIIMGNRPEAVAAIFASAMVGAVAVPM